MVDFEGSIGRFISPVHMEKIRASKNRTEIRVKMPARTSTTVAMKRSMASVHFRVDLGDAPVFDGALRGLPDEPVDDTLAVTP